MLKRPTQGAKTGSAVVAGTVSPEGTSRKDRIYSDFSGGMGSSRRYLKNGYAYGIGVDTRMPNLVMPAGAITEVAPLPSGLGEITDMFAFAGHIWFLAGRYILKVDAGSGTAYTIAWDLGGAYTGASAAALDGVYYVGRNGGGLTSFDGTTWTNSTALSRGFLGKSFWETADGTADDRLIASFSSTSVKFVTRGLSPMNDVSWVGPIQVGDGTRAITRIVSAPRHSYLYTTAAVHDLDSRFRTPPLTTYLQYDDNNGQVGLHRGDMLLYSAAAGAEGISVGTGALQQRPNPLHPGVALGIPDETPVYGRPVGYAHEPGTGWVKEAVYTGADSYLRWGRPAAEAGVQALGPWVWHGASAKLAGERISYIGYAENIANHQTQLWIASVTSGGTVRLRWMSVPKSSTPYQDYLGGGLHRYQAEWSLAFSVDDFDDPGAQKTIERYTLSGEQLTDGASLAVSTSIEGVNPTRQGSLTRGTGTKFEGRTEFIGTGLPRQGYQVGFLVEGRNTMARPALLRELTARAHLSVRRATQVQYRIDGSDQVMLNNRTISKVDPEILFARLRGIGQRGPATLRNHRRKTQTVTIDDVRWEDRDAPKGEESGLDRTIVATVTILSQTIHYNTGDLLNAGGAYA